MEEEVSAPTVLGWRALMVPSEGAAEDMSGGGLDWIGGRRVL